MKMAPSLALIGLAVLLVLVRHAGADSVCQQSGTVTLGNYGDCNPSGDFLKVHADISGATNGLNGGETLTCTSVITLSSANCQAAGGCGTVYSTTTVTSPPITSTSQNTVNSANCPQFPSNPPAGCGTLGYASIPAPSGWTCKGFMTWQVQTCIVSPSGAESTYTVPFQVGANLYSGSNTLIGGFDGGGGSNYGGSNSCQQTASGSISADPHFQTGNFSFYFSGDAGSSYCVLSESRLHINSRLVGERPDAPINTEGTENGTWMDSINIIFSKAGGIQHSLTVLLDQEKEFEAQDCFDFELDGDFFSVPSASTEVVFLSTTEPQFNVTRRAGQRAAAEVVIDGIGSINFDVDIDERIQVDPAGKFLNMYVKDLVLDADVHGILGQFFARDATAKKDELWNRLSPEDIIRRDMVDGDDNDYKSSSLTATDCPVSRYNVPQPDVAIRRMMLTSKKDVQHELTEMNCHFNGKDVLCA